MIKAVLDSNDNIIGIVEVEHGFRGFLTRMNNNMLTSIGRVVPKSKLTKKQREIFNSLEKKC